MSFARQTAFLLVARVAGYVLAFVNSVLVARVLGADGLGEYAYAMGLAAIFGLLPNLGITTVVTRSVARDPQGTVAIFKTARSAQILLAGLVMIIILIFAAMLPKQPVPLLYIGLAAAQLALGSLSWPYLAVVTGYGRYDRLAWVELSCSLLSSVLLVTAVVVSGKVPAVLGSHIVGAAIAIVLARHAAGPFLKYDRVTAPVSLRTLLCESAPYGATAVVQSLYTRIDILLLGQLTTATLVGLYSAAYKPITLAVYLGGTVAGALFPFLAQRSELPPMFERTVRTLIICGPAGALVLTGLSAEALTMLYGSDFRDAAPILALLAWSVVGNWFYAPLGVAMQAKGQERSWLAILAGGLLINIAGNLAMIPYWGGVGAAAATVTSEVAVLLGALGVLRPRTTATVAAQGMLIATMAAAGGAAALWLCSTWGPLGSTLVALIVYGSSLLLARQVTLDDAWAIPALLRQSVRGASRG